MSSSAPHVVEDCLGIVQLLSDGTVRRSTDYSVLPLLGAVPSHLPVQWKDVVYDGARGLRLRMYRPTGGGEKGEKRRLPVLVYFHGGGFCIASFELPNFHAGALRLAADSAGGNIAHHIAARHGSGGLALDPLRLAGCVMLWPYFGGEERTPSEAAASAPGDPMGTALYDQMWRLALPEGATRDHPAANPFAPGSVPLDAATAFPPALVVDPQRDALTDRIAEYVARLKAAGKAVELVQFKEQGHAFFVAEPCGEASDELIRVIRRFVHGA